MATQKATLTLADIAGQEATFDTNKAIPVQFNPASLRVTYSVSGGQGSQSASANTGKQTASTQPTSYSASLSVDLVFDTSQSGKDVRNEYTLKVASMLTKPGSKKMALVQFHWGQFIFKGSIPSMTETLDFFSEDGVPLRATVSLQMNEQSLEPNDPKTGGTAGAGGAGAGFAAGASAGFSASAGVSAGAGLSVGASASLSASVGVGAGIGTTPLTLAQAGDTLQSLTARAGAGASWKAIAAANNIDNPRLLDPGAVLNLNARADINLK
jgi:hypothetical protein